MGHKRDFHQLQAPPIIIIPMIDIMLFLLVFFMISSMSMVQLNTMPVDLPAANAVQRETKPTIISITVTRDGKIFYNKDTSPSKGVKTKIKEDVAKNPETYFVIRGDRKTSLETITLVLDALKECGAKHVTLAAEDKKG